MSPTPKQGDGILTRLPKAEQQFLLNQADLILQKSSGTIEDLCQHVANIFGDKQYGWQEAIHDNKWYRYPSEVKEQRFCSEEALKNYLLLRTLGVPVEYCLLENYQRTSMAHEVVLIPTEDSTYLIDWQTVSPITIEPEAFILKNSKIPFKTLHRLPEEKVLDRVLSLREGERFLDSITCAQILSIKDAPEGELQSTVCYFPEEKYLEFTFIFTRYTGGMKFYLRHETGVDANNTIYDAQEFGLCEVANRETTKEFPIIYSMNGKMDDLVNQLTFFQKLSTQQQHNICMESMYNQFSSDSDAFEGKFVTPQSERLDTLAQFQELIQQNNLPQDLKETIQAYITIYDTYHKINPYAAEKFLDFQISKMTFEQLFPVNQDLGPFWKQYEANPFWTSTLYLCSALRDLGKAFSSTDAFQTSNILTKELCAKTNIEFKPCTFSQLFEIVGNFANMNRQELYARKEKDDQKENITSSPKGF